MNQSDITKERTPAGAEDPEAIREEVVAYYSKRARAVQGGNGDASCCSSAPAFDEDGYRFYNDDELALTPAAAGEASLGCGNPTTIASLRPGETVLDLGSGGGIDVFLAARQVGGGGFVYGVDMTDEMLALARENARRGGFDNVAFRKGHIEDLPLPDERIDVIMSNCVINLSPDKGQTLGEAFRVLKPGGRLAVSDIVIDGDLSDLPVDEATVRAALKWAGCIAGALTIDQFRQTLEEAGFEAIDIRIKHRYRLSDLGQDMESVRGTLSPEIAEQLVGRFVSADIAARRPE